MSNLTPEGRAAIQAANQRRNNCRKCGAATGVEERDGSTCGGLPGLKYRMCNNCGHAQPITKRSTRSENLSQFKRRNTQ